MVLCYIQMPSSYLNLKYLIILSWTINHSLDKPSNVLTQFKTLSHLDFSFPLLPCPQNSYHVPLPHSSPKSLLSAMASVPFQPLYLCTSCFSLCMPCAHPVPGGAPRHPSGPRSLVYVSMKSPLSPGSLGFPPVCPLNTLNQSSLITKSWPVVPMW